MQKPLSPHALNTQIKALLEETFLSVCVEGEISNLVVHSSGHIYFSLKDAQSSIKCVLFRGNAQGLNFKPENGQKILAFGGVSVYPPRGDYQILCKKIVLNSMGHLYEAYEALKKKLEEKGYFSAHKPLPPFPHRIALLTSSTGAALQDMLRVASKRWKLAELILLPTLVQGEGAKESIVKNIFYADTLGVDLIILARGGGSQEDLWAFNEEIVAEAIYQARTPIVSAIGHESDVMISDFVADLRAPTPSAAMEMVLPDQIQWLYRLEEMREHLNHLFRAHLSHQSQILLPLQKQFALLSPQSKLQAQTQILHDLRSLFALKLQALLQHKRASLMLPQTLLSLDILAPFAKQLKELKEIYTLQQPKTQRGYAQITQNGKILELEELKEGEQFELSNTKVSLLAQLLPKS